MRLSRLPHLHPATKRAAFTLVELLVVLVTVAILIVLASSGLGSARDGTQTVRCLSNHRQLVTAWLMYSDDNDGRLAMNILQFDDSPTESPWATGTLRWSTESESTNVSLLIEEKYSKLAKYFNRDPLVYQCPADRYVSPAQRDLGWSRRARSYSMNAALGDGDAVVLGPWDHLYKWVNTTADLARPGPGKTFVFIEEHPDSLFGPPFYPPSAQKLYHAPSNRHNGAGVVSFADGHSEAHSWSGVVSGGRLNRVLYESYSSSSIQVPPNDPDVHWLSLHSPRNTDKSY